MADPTVGIAARSCRQGSCSIYVNAGRNSEPSASTAQTTREDVPTKILPDQNNRDPTDARLLFVDTWLSNGQQKV